MLGRAIILHKLLEAGSVCAYLQWVNEKAAGEFPFAMDVLVMRRSSADLTTFDGGTRV
jgi:hypothetical protein